MARLNILNLNFGPRTHEGTPAATVSPELQLRRSVLACLLWESSSTRMESRSPAASPSWCRRSRRRRWRRLPSRRASR